MKKIILYFNYLTYLVCLLVPKKQNRWVFGAWFGKRISDNPYAVYKYIQKEHPEIEAIWICNNVTAAERMGLTAIKRNSLKGIWKCLTAKVSIMNQGYLDFGSLNWIHKTYKVQLWHGVPWKKIGEDMTDESKGLLHLLSHKTFLFVNRADLYIAPSINTQKVLKSAFCTEISDILLVGQPRNEILMSDDYCKWAREKLMKTIGPFNKIILFMPTFRDKSSTPFSFVQIERSISKVLKEYNSVILEKQHFVELGRRKEDGKNIDNIINVADYETQDLLAAADVLITDYSSCFFDFVLRDKPIIHYLYDYEVYKNKDRGLYYEADDVVAGTIAYNETELITAITRLLSGDDLECGRRKKVKEEFCTYESPDNSKIVYNRIMKDIVKGKT